MSEHTNGDLLQAYLDGELSAGEVDALEARLKAEPEMARSLVRLAREDGMLHEWACAQGSVEETAPPETVPLPAARRASPWRKGGLAAAAVLLAALGSYFLLAPEPTRQPPAPVAKVEDIQGNVFLVTRDGDRPALAGQGLYPGQKVSTRGEDSFAVIQYADATRLELGGDTTVSLPAGSDASAGKRIYLVEGQLSAEVPRPQGFPMILRSPHAEVTALGSKLSFWSVPGGTRIESEDGPIRLKRRSDGQSVELPTGSYAVASLDPTPLVSRPLPALLSTPRAVLDEGSGPVLSLAFLPDGRTLVTGGWKGEVKFWDAASGRLERSFRAAKNTARTLALSRDGEVLVTAGEDRLARVWDPATGVERGSIKLKQNPACLGLSPDGKLLAVSSLRARGIAEVRLFDVATLQEWAALLGHVHEVRALDFAPDGRTLAAGSRDGTIKLWAIDTQQELRTLAGTGTEVEGLRFSADGRTLAAGCRDGSILLWDTADWRVRRLEDAHPRGVRSVAFSPDGRALVTTGHDAAVRLWDVATGEQRLLLRGHRYNATTAVFAPDGRTLATGGSDKTVRLWSMTPAGPVAPRKI